MPEPEVERKGYSAAREALIEFDARRKEARPPTTGADVSQDSLKEFFDLLKNAEANLRSWRQFTVEERVARVRALSAPVPVQKGMFQDNRARLERQRRLKLAACLFQELRLDGGSRRVVDVVLDALMPVVPEP